ncbi:MAG TPA: type VII secretion protein EccB [Amycolatopsis sp.]|nr:type VII secretion protein EccB [Amycolatopsis sp.]
MQTRRDHVQAYKFFTGRLSAALVAGDPGTADVPLRRSGLGTGFGVAVAVLLCVGFAVYGLISPGGATTWQAPGSIVVEKETGNRYLYLNGTLFPTRNTASAMLFYGNGDGHVVDVSRNSLAGVPHGPEVGIPGAPDTIPQGSALLPGAWSLCATPGSSPAGLTVSLGSDLPSGPSAAAGWRVLVSSGGSDYVLWQDVAYRIGSPGMLIALGLGDAKAIPVTATWLSALRQGVTIAAPDIPGAGSAGPSVGGEPAQVGQLFVTTVGGGTQYYLLRRDGIAPVGHTVFALLSAESDEPPVRTVSAAALTGVPVSADTSTLDSLPDFVDAPAYRPGTGSLCVSQRSSGGAVTAGSLVVQQLGGAAAAPLTVAAGRGMYAYALPVSANSAPSLFLVTDQGMKFPLSQQAATALQLGADPVGVPGAVLDAMPDGPALSTGNSILTATTSGGQ